MMPSFLGPVRRVRQRLGQRPHVQYAAAQAKSHRPDRRFADGQRLVGLVFDEPWHVAHRTGQRLPVQPPAASLRVGLERDLRAPGQRREQQAVCVQPNVLVFTATAPWRRRASRASSTTRVSSQRRPASAQRARRTRPRRHRNRRGRRRRRAAVPPHSATCRAGIRRCGTRPTRARFRRHCPISPSERCPAARPPTFRRCRGPRSPPTRTRGRSRRGS